MFVGFLTARTSVPVEALENANDTYTAGRQTPQVVRSIHRRTHLGLEPEAELKHGYTIYERVQGEKVTSDTSRPIMVFHGFDDHVRP